MLATVARLVLGFLCATRTYVSDAKCTIDLNKDVKADSPLLLGASSLRPIYPQRTSSQFLSFNSGQRYLLYCPGGTILRSNRDTNSTIDATKCTNGKSFSSASKRNIEYSFDEVVCSKSPSPVTKSNPKKKCMADGSGVILEIGYQIKDGEFRRTIELCHLENLATTSWAHSTIRDAIGGSKATRGAGTPSFSKGSYFKDVLMSKVYPRTNQVETFMNIFSGDKSLVDRYLPQEKGRARNYLVRGHLVARADMLFYAEQYSTYSYLNVLPMWQSINNGNWKSVESTVRRTSNAVGDLEVYTGGLGVLRLSGKEIYLSRDRRLASKLLIPVPRLLFKLVYSRSLRQALVFVTINNPYLTNGSIANEYIICRSEEHVACRTSQFDKRYEGFTYCCSYDDFFSSQTAKVLNLPLLLKNVAPLSLH